MIHAALLAAAVAIILAPTADAAGKRCRRGEIAVHGIVRGDRIDLRAGRGPVMVAWPVQRAMKRFPLGPEEGIRAWGAGLGLRS